MEIWGAGTTRSFRPIWTAEELGLEYELKPIGPRTGETQTAEYTAMNRKQKIPFLIDGDVRLSESVAICRYLISNYSAEAVWSPQTPIERAKEDEWTCYIYGEIDETSLYVMRRHGDLKEIYGGSDEIVRSAATYAERHLQVLSEYMSGRPYLMDGGFSLPDILLVSCLDWALFYSVNVPDSLQEYRQRLAERPAYKKAVQINYKNLLGA